MADDEPPQGGRENEPSSGAPEQGASLTELARPVQVPSEIRNVSFPLSVRGYSRQAVDAYVERVNRVIAELEVGSSPRAAVRHALDRVTEQVGGILERARESAEQITASAREEAEENSARAKAEAAELVVNASDEADRTRVEAEELTTKARAEVNEILAHSRAEAEAILTRSREEAAERLERVEEELGALREQAETRMRELQADTEAVWKERRELLDEIRGMAARLGELASAAAARLPSREPAEPTEQAMLEPQAEAQTEASGGEATDELTRAKLAVDPVKTGGAKLDNVEREGATPDSDR